MKLLSKLKIRNFKCFRDWTSFDLHQSTYLAGANNSGKTAVLAAIDCFFNDEKFSQDLINRTELTSRKEGYNRSEIRVTFDLTSVTGSVRGPRMVSSHGRSLEITKSFTWREASGVSIEYRVGNSSPRGFDDLDGDVQHMLKSVAVSYIHPQEGVELLKRAQDKFKQRLFHNWGRHSSVAERVNEVQEKWVELRMTANNYLSSALSARLRDLWPGAEVQIDLPERIQDVVAVSDITFRSSPNLPQITLPSHGTGAQSTILYQTHYLLDSDRTLHQGMYFPIWLLEEPESFLHADIAVQLSQLLSSDEWLSSIQMLVSTHSAIILAGSRQAPDKCTWAIVKAHALAWQKPVTQVTDTDVENVGQLMGDANFSVYFDAASRSPRVFLEDSRELTRSKFEDCGVAITECLGGTAIVKKYLDVLTALGKTLAGETYFVVDFDKGANSLKRFVESGTELNVFNGWRKVEVTPRVYLILLPEGCAAESLFSEWDEILDEAID
ncbi:AAA family ATPase, partial [bacterium]|nr:AAA family ATPase [bacterium]